MKLLDLKFNLLTLIAAVVASLAATATAGLQWPVWAMFVGWVAFFTGGHSGKHVLASYLCIVLGLSYGTVAATAVAALLPLIGAYAFGVVVFAVAILVVSLRASPWITNIAAYFLGLIAFFASHLPPQLLSVLELAPVCGIGIGAAWVAHRCSARLMRKPA